LLVTCSRLAWIDWRPLGQPLQARNLCLQIIGMDIQMHPARPLAQTLDEQPESLSR
jgi:hypothetical protein